MTLKVAQKLVSLISIDENHQGFISYFINGRRLLWSIDNINIDATNKKYVCGLQGQQYQDCGLGDTQAEAIINWYNKGIV